MQLSPHFTTAEFACSCGCGTCNVSPALLALLEAMRDEIGAMKINSGCRCATNNSAIGGAKTSSHLASKTEPCEASDISAPTSQRRYEVVKAATRCGALQIEVCSTWVHVGVDPSKGQKILYTQNEA